jgi:hypothetical protein
VDELKKAGPGTIETEGQLLALTVWPPHIENEHTIKFCCTEFVFLAEYAGHSDDLTDKTVGTVVGAVGL